MGWTATLINVHNPTDITNDWIEFTMDFNHTDGRKYTKTYKYFVDDLTDISLQFFIDQVLIDKARLEKLDTITTTLNTVLGGSI